MMPMGEMPTMRQVQSENSVARLDDCSIRRHVRLRSRMWLHVRVLRAEQLLRTVACQVLDNVGIFASAVISLSRIPLGVLVRKHRAHGFKDGFADKVLRRDEFQALMLAANFVVDRGSH